MGGSNNVRTIHRTMAPNIRTIHRNSTWLRRKSNYAVPIKHTTLFLFPTNHKFKNPANFSAGSREKILFAKHEPGSNNHPLSCKHLANANVKPMKNTENTMKFPPTKRLRMDIHDLNICYPSCKLIPTHRKPPRQTQHVATQYRFCLQKCGREFGSWRLILILWPHFWGNLALVLLFWGCKMQTGVAPYGGGKDDPPVMCFRQCKLAAVHIGNTLRAYAR